MKEKQSFIRREPSVRKSASFRGFRCTDRVPAELLVNVSDNDGLNVFLPSMNISLGGMFLKSPILFEEGRVHTLSFEDPLTREFFSVVARVVRVAGSFSDCRRRTPPSNLVPGMGYEFINVDERVSEKLERMLASFS